MEPMTPAPPVPDDHVETTFLQSLVIVLFKYFDQFLLVKSRRIRQKRCLAQTGAQRRQNNAQNRQPLADTVCIGDHQEANNLQDDGDRGAHTADKNTNVSISLSYRATVKCHIAWLLLLDVEWQKGHNGLDRHRRNDVGQQNGARGNYVTDTRLALARSALFGHCGIILGTHPC